MPLLNVQSSLPAFVFVSGYKLTLDDLGDDGVKISMEHSIEESACVLLPLEKTNELAEWLGRRIGRPYPKFKKKGVKTANTKL